MLKKIFLVAFVVSFSLSFAYAESRGKTYGVVGRDEPIVNSVPVEQAAPESVAPAVSVKKEINKNPSIPKSILKYEMTGSYTEESFLRTSKEHPDQPILFNEQYYYLNGEQVTKEALIENKWLKPDEQAARDEKIQSAYDKIKVTLFIILVAVTIVGVIFAFKGQVIFFNSYGDAFLNFSPIILVMVEWQTHEQIWWYLALVSALVISSIQAFRYNPTVKWKIPIVAIGRFIMGFIAPLFIIFMWVFGRGTKSARRDGETEAAYLARLKIESIEELATKTALTTGWLFLMTRLINGAAVRQSRGDTASKRSK